MIDVVRDIPYTDVRDQRNALNLFLPVDRQGPALVFFFGGGLSSGCKEDLDGVGREFAEHGIAVAAPDYRYYPEVSFPTFIEDAADAVAWVSRRIGGVHEPLRPVRRRLFGGRIPVDDAVF